jgi:hypothetical protein
MKIRKRSATAEINFWLNIVTQRAGVGPSRLPRGKWITDKERLEYVGMRLRHAGKQITRTSIEPTQASEEKFRA